MKRTLQVGALALGIVVAASACSSSSNAGAVKTTAMATTTSTAVSVPTTPTVAPLVTTTTSAGASGADTTTTAAVTPAALPPCQAVLQEYTDVFTPDDLMPAAAFFRKYAPLMPADVAASSLRIAAAYEKVGGDMSKLSFDDPALTADATVFSNWTSAGCPSK